MAIEKMMEPSDFDIEDTDAEEIEVEIVNPEAVSIETDDGGVIIDFEGGISKSFLGQTMTPTSPSSSTNLTCSPWHQNWWVISSPTANPALSGHEPTSRVSTC